MKIYADLGPRRAAQLMGDLLLVGWVAVWVWLGTQVHDAVEALGVVGVQVEAGGSDLSGRLGDAGDRAAEVPLVGDRLQAPFTDAAAAAESLAEAGRTQQEVVGDLALLLGATTVVVPVAILALIWVPRRVQFVRRAGAAQRHLDSAADLDVFALRALAGQPLHRLARISDDPVAAWRRADQQVLGRLADLELRDLGLRMPERLRRPG